MEIERPEDIEQHIGQRVTFGWRSDVVGGRFVGTLTGYEREVVVPADKARDGQEIAEITLVFAEGRVGFSESAVRWGMVSLESGDQAHGVALSDAGADDVNAGPSESDEMPDGGS